MCLWQCLNKGFPKRGSIPIHSIDCLRAIQVGAHRRPLAVHFVRAVTGTGHYWTWLTPESRVCTAPPSYAPPPPCNPQPPRISQTVFVPNSIVVGVWCFKLKASICLLLQGVGVCDTNFVFNSLLVDHHQAAAKKNYHLVLIQ